MGIDLSRFKVIHGGMVLNAIALMEVRMPDDMDYSNRDTIVKPRFIEVLAWTFQFVPNITKFTQEITK